MISEFGPSDLKASFVEVFSQATMTMSVGKIRACCTRIALDMRLTRANTGLGYKKPPRGDREFAILERRSAGLRSPLQLGASMVVRRA